MGSLGQKSLRFSYDDFQNISFKQETGTVYACVNYTTDQLLEQSGENLVSIRKVVTPVEGNNGVGKATRVELIINFEEDAPLGYSYGQRQHSVRYAPDDLPEEGRKTTGASGLKMKISRSRPRFTGILREMRQKRNSKNGRERRIVYYISGSASRRVCCGESALDLINPVDEILRRGNTQRSTCHGGSVT